MIAKRYAIAPIGQEPPELATWRPVLDHRMPDGKLAMAWVHTDPLDRRRDAAHIPEGATLYLVPGHLWDVWPGPEAPRRQECYSSWRRRSPHQPTGFDQPLPAR